MDFKTYDQYKNIAISKAAKNLPQIDAATDPVILTLAEAPAGVAYSLQGILIDLIEELFPQTASGAFLQNAWGNYEFLYPLAATASIGYLNVISTTTVPEGTKYSIGGYIFATTGSSVSVSGTYTIALSQTTSSKTVSVTVSTPHYLGTGNTVTITSTAYNGDFVVNVTGETTFTFEAETIPVAPISETGQTYVIANSEYVKVRCESTGIATNYGTGTLQPVTAGSTDVAYVAYGGLSGGEDKESDDSYRSRILLARSLIQGDFTNGQIILSALSINGNTRVFVVNPSITGTGLPDSSGTHTANYTQVGTTGVVLVTTTTPHGWLADQSVTIANTTIYDGVDTIATVESPTSFTLTDASYSADVTAGTVTYLRATYTAANKGLTPIPGVVYVFVLRDDDSDITPSEALLDLTKTAILVGGKLPSHTPAENVVVFAPTLSYLSFELDDLLPNTEGMKAAIKTQLSAFFEDNATLSTDISVDAIRAAIWETEDVVTNERITQFTLTRYGQNDGSTITPDTAVPDGVITIAAGSIAAFDPNSIYCVTEAS